MKNSHCIFGSKGLILILWILISFCESKCPGSCTQCDKNSFGDIVNVTCRNSGDFQLIPRNIHNIVFQNGKLHLGILKDFYFLGIHDLESVKISNYQLTELWGPIFSNCSELTRIDFTNNKIHSISSENFEGPSALEILRLDKNEISILPDDVFKDLGSLKELYLADNQISVLTKLALNGLINLHKLDISRNVINSVEANTFSSLSNIEEIYLITNQLTSIHEHVYNGLARLRVLKLSHNSIVNILSNALRGTRITDLDLSWNKLAKIPTTLLKQISGKETSVNLQQNNIRVLTAYSLENVTLKFLNLALNKMARVEGRATVNCKVKYINMAVNLLTSLPATMENYLSSRINPELVLYKNPLICDCSIRWLGEFLLSHRWHRIPVCTTPLQYAGKTLSDYYLSSNDSCVTTTKSSITSVFPYSHINLSKKPTSRKPNIITQIQSSTNQVRSITAIFPSTSALKLTNNTPLSTGLQGKSSVKPTEKLTTSLTFKQPVYVSKSMNASPTLSPQPKVSTSHTTSTRSTTMSTTNNGPKQTTMISANQSTKATIFHSNTTKNTTSNKKLTTQYVKNTPILKTTKTPKKNSATYQTKQSISVTMPTASSTNLSTKQLKITLPGHSSYRSLNSSSTFTNKETSITTFLSKIQLLSTSTRSQNSIHKTIKTKTKGPLTTSTKVNNITLSPNTEPQALPTAAPRSDRQLNPTAAPHTDIYGNIIPPTRNHLSSKLTESTLLPLTGSTSHAKTLKTTHNSKNITIPATSIINFQNLTTGNISDSTQTSQTTKNKPITPKKHSTITMTTTVETDQSSNSSLLTIGLPILIILLIIIAILLFLLLFMRSSKEEEKEDLWPYYKYDRRTLGPANTVFKYKKCKQ